jgi:hypothetical protein
VRLAVDERGGQRDVEAVVAVADPGVQEILANLATRLYLYPRAGVELPVLQQFFYGEAYIFSDLTEQDRGNITACVKGDGSRATIGMTELLVRASLTDLYEAERREDADHLARFQDRNSGH